MVNYKSVYLKNILIFILYKYSFFPSKKFFQIEIKK